MAAGISIQDVPEGLVVALALRSVGYGHLLSVGLGMASGIIAPVAAAFGVAPIGISTLLRGAQEGDGTSASVTLVGGSILMTVPDTAMA